jgi:tRNA pseudouridine38-40 synthase
MRYFLEVGYKGTKYSGFQVQQNANSIQGEVERALSVILRQSVALTGSSRTDAGVHALQNFFHFDLAAALNEKTVYNLNALLPHDIVVRSVFPVPTSAHCRFLATSRHYKYYITTTKDPFNSDTAWYYPFSVDVELLQKVSGVLYHHRDYTSFAKRNSNVFTHECTITKSEWLFENNMLIYSVQANRFLRGMVRGLVGTMLLVGRNKISTAGFEEILQSHDCTRANFATPAHGLFLTKVNFPKSLISL